MNSISLTYRGMCGTVERSDEDGGLLYGRVMGIRSMVSYEGETIGALRDSFRGAVDSYLEHLAEVGNVA